MIVTDENFILNKGKSREKETKGLYMNGYLKQNLDGIPPYLKKAWDVVGIVSGHGKVRIGKSTMASQIAYYLAWLLAGGRQICHLEEIAGKQVWVQDKMISPTKPVRFNLQENVVFEAEQLQKAAFALHDKYGKHQVILYDEGRQGLDSARAMESINKGMGDFFETCGFMGHVILIVLPNFFKLHEDYAVARSLFLIDVFADKKNRRGYYNFYNERQKEWLYYLGKRRIGVTGKYEATWESFWGRFTDCLPFDKDEYEKLKKLALENKKLTRQDRKMRLQRDCFVWMLAKDHKVSAQEMVQRLYEITDLELTEQTINEAVAKISELKVSAKGY